MELSLPESWFLLSRLAEYRPTELSEAECRAALVERLVEGIRQGVFKR